MIIHFKTVKEVDLLSLIAEHIVQKIEDVQKLLEMGAIYVEKKRTLTNQSVPVDTYIRVHLQPKRYVHKESEDLFETLDPSHWIVAEEEDFYIVDKPHGLPSHPTLDNIHQNLLALLKKHFQKDLWLPHRLDVGTAGLIIVAKSQEAAYRIQQDFIGRKIQKIYRALVENPLQPALHEHFMKKTKTAPKAVTLEPAEDSQNCLLRITDCKLVKSSLNNEDLYQLTLEPITGRTHQIRAQLTFLGCPIVGDKMYGSKREYLCEDQKLFTQESFALEAHSIVWNKTWTRSKS